MDRTEFLRLLNQALTVDPSRTAVVTIDCHRGHLDPGVATMPVRAEAAARVVVATARLVGSVQTELMPELGPEPGGIG
jgi:hypothetical protein